MGKKSDNFGTKRVVICITNRVSFQYPIFDDSLIPFFGGSSKHPYVSGTFFSQLSKLSNFFKNFGQKELPCLEKGSEKGVRNG